MKFSRQWHHLTVEIIENCNSYTRTVETLPPDKEHKPLEIMKFSRQRHSITVETLTLKKQRDKLLKF